MAGQTCRHAEAEEAAVAVAEEKLARGEQLPELELHGPIEEVTRLADKVIDLGFADEDLRAPWWTLPPRSTLLVT